MDSNKLPYNKVMAATLGAAVAGIFTEFFEAVTHYDISDLSEKSIVVVFVFVCGYVVKERPSVGGQLLNRAKKKNGQ